MNELSISGTRGDFYVSVTVSVAGSRQFVQFTDRLKAREFAAQLRQVADQIDPDIPACASNEHQQPNDRS